ncbi:MAG: thiol-disulfide isomerase/thioredoxin [Crocinitomicaceae bacterium]|jgi:thiol-disulfide isomerase/thioredoxin
MKKYIITFLITSTIFLSAFFISDRVNVSRIEQLDNVQEKISLNILTTETRFALLEESSCENIFEGSQLEVGITKDLNQLVTRIKFLESELGGNNQDVQILKQRYTLLQIKDFLLVRKLSQKCEYTIPTVLYFYTSDCFDCRRQSIILDQIRSEYNQVRVYWMDSSLDEPTTNTLERLYNIETYPTMVLGDENYSGFISYDNFSRKLLLWSKDNNINLLSEEDLIRIGRGRQYILSLDRYSQLQSKNISFGKEINNIYEYFVTTMNGEEPELVQLEYTDGEFLVKIVPNKNT